MSHPVPVEAAVAAALAVSVADTVVETAQSVHTHCLYIRWVVELQRNVKGGFAKISQSARRLLLRAFSWLLKPMEMDHWSSRYHESLP